MFKSVNMAICLTYMSNNRGDLVTLSPRRIGLSPVPDSCTRQSRGN